MNNDLQVRTIEFKPAVVEFNFNELTSTLDVQLQKYKGLTFTDDTATECKKTIAELNKAKKALDTYRKDTKKELTASVTAFENQCKDLTAKFDEVIAPLKEQYDDFEWQRKEEKRKEIEPIIKDLIEKEGLNEKYSPLLVIPDEYYNKSKSMKSIKDELTTKAEHLGIQQDKDDSEREVIEGYVEVINAKNGLNLVAAPYVALIGEKLIEDIKKLVDTVIPKPSKQTVSTGESVTEKYSVVGTDDQLDALEQYMTNHGIKWAVIEG